MLLREEVAPDRNTSLYDLYLDGILELRLVFILRLGPLSSVVSISISGAPKSTIYSIGLVNSSIILNLVFSFIELGIGSYNFINKLNVGWDWVSILTPVKITFSPKFKAKSLKYSSSAPCNSTTNSWIPFIKGVESIFGLSLALISVLLGEISSIKKILLKLFWIFFL